MTDEALVSIRMATLVSRAGPRGPSRSRVRYVDWPGAKLVWPFTAKAGQAPSESLRSQSRFRSRIPVGGSGVPSVGRTALWPKTACAPPPPCDRGCAATLRLDKELGIHASSTPSGHPWPARGPFHTAGGLPHRIPSHQPEMFGRVFAVSVSAVLGIGHRGLCRRAPLCGLGSRLSATAIARFPRMKRVVLLPARL